MRASHQYPARLRQQPGLAAEPHFQPHYLPSSADDGMDIFRKLWRRKLLIVAAAVSGGVVAGLVSLTLDTRYAAESRVLIGVDTPKITSVPDFLQDVTANQEVVQSQSYVLMSRSLAEQVVHRMALDQDPEFNPTLRPVPAWREHLADAKAWLKDTASDLLHGGGEEGEPREDEGPSLSEEQWQERLNDIIVSHLLARIDVTPIQRSHVLSISAQSESPETATRIANTVAQTYIEQQLIRRAQVGEHATEWLDERIGELREKVETAERATEEYRRTHGLLETRSDQVTAQQLTGLNTQLVMAEAELASAEARLSQAEAARRAQQPVESLPSVLNSPLVQALLQRKVEADRQAAELASTLGPQHPRILEINAQRADIRRRIADEVAKVVQALRHEVDAARARVQGLRGNLSGLERQLADDNRNAIQLRELERQAEANRRLLVSFLDRAKEAESQPNSEEQTTVIISKAVVPYAPSYPPRTMIGVLGIVGGTLIGMVLALFRENLDRTFRTARQVEEATNLPVLGLLPPMEQPIRGRPPTGNRLNSPFNQALGNLLERLVYAAPEHRAGKLLMLTSATPQEGKTGIAVALVRLMARHGLRVIILDCDWRRPSVNRYFGRPTAPGLGDLLAGTATPDEVVYQDAETGVHAIFAGDVSKLPDSAERFARLRLLHTTLARHYDMVIVDTPPVLTGPDTLMLGRMTDDVAFVARWGHVSRDVVVDALRNLAFNGAKLTGVVLSDVNQRRYRGYGAGDVVYPYPAKHLEGVA